MATVLVELSEEAKECERMDKYEFNHKVDQIRKMVNKDDYVTAKKIADNIDWKRVSNANLLSMISQVYEKNGEYKTAKSVLMMAFERAPIGKRLLYKLTELALKEGSTEEAEEYYREFCDVAGDDPRQYLLRYMVLKQKKAPMEQRIHALESYTSEELDEKWLYELALLYHENGDISQSISTCDRLTLMFGLGKYVDKAIDLKRQHAPLSKYQEDLVENREKYEEKLRKVELSFQEDEEVTEEEEEYVREPELLEEREEPTLDDKKLVYPVKEEPEEAEPAALEIQSVPYEEDELAAEAKQAEAEEYLAREMSRIEPGAYEEDELGKTRVIGDIRRSSGESRPKAAEVAKPQEKESPLHSENSVEPEAAPNSRASRRAIHLMIEARNPERGVDIAVEALRQVRQFTGIKNPVAKITGSRLNKRGVLNSAEKLAGKDLMIEEAGDMDPGTIGELERLMSRDNTGMRVILIDNPQQIDRLEKEYSSMAEWFDFIREEDVVEVPVEMPQEEPADYEMYEKASYSAQQEPEAYMGYGTSEMAGQPEVSMYTDYQLSGDSDQLYSSEYDAYNMGEESGEPAEYEEVAEPEQEIDDRPVRRVVPVRDTAMRAPDGQDIYMEDDSEEEMGIDEFAQYACQYATDIDCSITGKSMLALYERIEIMEEDGIPLTRGNAEELIEEAADRAERPSFGKAIKGIFSSKYNKDGLLILKEEHFI